MIDTIGVTGIKTGITNSAGPCLATAITMDGESHLIIVLLNCKNTDCRWQETYKLAKWASKRMKKIRQFQTDLVKSGEVISESQNARLLQRIKHL